MDVDEEIEVDVTKGRLKTKGRGHRARQDGNDSEIGRGGVFESIDSAKGAPRPRGAVSYTHLTLPTKRIV